MILFTLLSFLSFSTQSTSRANEPLVSATNPFYLSCTYWDGKTFTDPASRSAMTPILESKNGFRAYGEVRVTVKDGNCDNTTTLFVASTSNAEFKTAYTKEGDGNGIRLVGWSPDQTKLLFEVNNWRYFSDGGFENVSVIYDSKRNSTAEFPDLDKTIMNYFGSECDFEHSTRRWKTDSQFVVRITPPLPSEDEQHPCASSPLLLVYEIEKKAVSALEAKRK
jgi:hypothetical protein